MSDPLVSVLVPTYNGERFLRIALRSALEQSYRNLEVVVVDDGSTDRTAEILAATAAADERVRVIRREQNAGAYDNPRLIFTEARGEYVKYLLHDDVLAPDCIRVLVRGMQAHPEATLAFSRRNIVNEDGRPVPGGELQPLKDRAGLIDGRELGDACLESGSNLIGEVTTVLFRRADVDFAHLWQLDGRRMEVLGDLSLWLRLLSRGPAFYSPQALSRFRLHAGQESQDPRLVARGIRDWPRIIDWGIRHGFLEGVDRQRRAFARTLQGASGRVAQLIDTPHYGPALEALFLAMARIVELGGDVVVDPARDLAERAHSAEATRRFGQELDVWLTTPPVAVAHPAADVDEVRATLEGFQQVRNAGIGTRFVVAAATDVLDQISGLVAGIRDEFSDVDVELVATDTPAMLFGRPWLAVAPRGATWHEGRADSLWQLDPARDTRGERSSVGA